jgi:hypothetical protein
VVSCLFCFALADWADDQGRCWPSVPAIAQKARLKERQVYNILQKFRADEIIQCAPGGGRGHSTNYLINTATHCRKNPALQCTQTLQWSANPPDPLIGRTVI